MKKWINKNLNKFSGSMLVTKQDEILVDGGFGFSDKDNLIKNESNTRFLIGSVSKIFTAVAIMKLYEKKLLDINDSVNKYLDINNLEDDIKIINLLNHTSGLKNYVMCGNKFDLNKENDPTYIATKVCEMKRGFKAGKKLSYNNTGYLMLAMIIESVTKLKFEDYIEKNIFSPLKMNDSGFIYNDFSQRAIGYNNGKLEKIFHPSAFFGCGDVISTTSDLKKFISSLNEGKIIKKSLVEEMKQVSTKNKMMNYGYGLMISEKMGEKGIGHGGSVPKSFSSQVSYYEDSDTFIIILCNDIRSIKRFIPSVMITQYVERCVYERIICKKIKLINKLTF